MEYARVISLPGARSTTETNCPGVKAKFSTPGTSNSKWCTSGASSLQVINLTLVKHSHYKMMPGAGLTTPWSGVICRRMSRYIRPRGRPF